MARAGILGLLVSVIYGFAGGIGASASEPSHGTPAKAEHGTLAKAEHGTPAKGSLAARLAKLVKARQNVAAKAGHGAPAKTGHGAVVAKSGHGAAAKSAHGAKPGKVHGWGYVGDGGPKHWGSLKQDYHVCRDGRMQSPIDIAGGFNGSGAKIKFDYKSTPLSILHNGHTIQVNYAPGSGITVSGKRYELLQFHFHTPSEHAVGHKRAAMEVHFVHKSADGQLAVVGALLQAGHKNKVLAKMWSHMPMKAGPAHKYPKVHINGADLLPKKRGYHRYMGSLTTPPCSEGVNWFVLTHPLAVGAPQVAKFTRAVSANARPLQALNDRLVLSPTAKN